jgi:hypothetical protein
MVNAGLVNAKSVCLNPVAFCVFLLESGRFPLFKKPVKYSRIFHVNHERGQFDLHTSYLSIAYSGTYAA